MSKLEFTGNWFIDGGILGFVNLMEEVYDWNLEELQQKILKDDEKIYYGYFPFAYLYKWLLEKNKTEKSKLKPELIQKLKEEIENNKFSKEELFDFVWYNFICELFEDFFVEEKLKLLQQEELYNKIKKKFNYNNKNDFLTIGKLKKTNDDLKSFLKKEWKDFCKKQKLNKKNSIFFRIPIDSGFYKNFLFFNTSKGNLEQKKSFYNLISFNYKEEKILKIIDKTINKLLFSEEESPNINYTRFSSSILKNQIKYLFVYLICFKYSFKNYKNIGNIFFYSNDLNFCYNVNKKLKKYEEKIKNYKNENEIFKVTLDQLIDLIFEYKSSWFLENMYIISYYKLDNKSQQNVEYIGIPKLQASILLDDTLRNHINIYIQYKSKHFKGNKYIWILKEFIKGQPLTPIFLQHLKLVLANETQLQFSVFYCCLIEAVIKKLKEKKGIFSSDFFTQNYKEINKEIKTEFRTAYYYSTQETKRLIKDSKHREKIAYLLLNSLYMDDKSNFINILLKEINNPTININNGFLKWLLENIVENNISWKEYGLFITAGLVYKNV